MFANGNLLGEQQSGSVAKIIAWIPLCVGCSHNKNQPSTLLKRVTLDELRIWGINLTEANVRKVSEIGYLYLN